MASREKHNGYALGKGVGLSSRVSLFSAFTSSSGSSGSTVTPESMSRVQSRKKSTTKVRSSKQMPQSRRKREGERAKHAQQGSPIDVFQFLDPSRNSTRTSLAGHGSSQPPLPANMEESPSSESCARSLHSDSGISLRDSSPEPLSRKQSDLEMVEEEKPLTHSLRGKSLAINKYQQGDVDNASEGSSSEDPESFYLGAAKQRLNLQKSSHQKRFPDRGLSGYDLLAHQLSEGEVQPMYRRFEWLQQRNLLQLQDELAELEEELKRLDDEDARFRLAARRSNNGQAIPASRRLDWQYQGTAELCGRRVEILAMAQVKLKQYNNMLRSYHKVSHELQEAHPDDVEQYRSWLLEAHPIAQQEANFLNCSDDLVAVGRTRSRHLRQQSAIQMVVMTVAGSIMIPLLAFSVIPSCLPRLFVITFTGLGLTRLSHSDRAREVIQQEQFRSCLGVYLGVMVVAALTVP